MLFRNISLAGTLLLMVAHATPGLANEPISKHKRTGITIGGHDTVAYHDKENIGQHKATKGDKEFSVDWMGATWLFTTAENRDAFLADPDKYRPAYGGHCANALSIGEGLIKTDGKTWEIFDNELYVYFAPRGRKRWNNGDWKSYKSDADKAWQEIMGLQ